MEKYEEEKEKLKKLIEIKQKQIEDLKKKLERVSLGTFSYRDYQYYCHREHELIPKSFSERPGTRIQWEAIRNNMAVGKYYSYDEARAVELVAYVENGGQEQKKLEKEISSLVNMIEAIDSLERSRKTEEKTKNFQKYINVYQTSGFATTTSNWSTYAQYSNAIWNVRPRRRPDLSFPPPGEDE